MRSSLSMDNPFIVCFNKFQVPVLSHPSSSQMSVATALTTFSPISQEGKTRHIVAGLWTFGFKVLDTKRIMSPADMAGSLGTLRVMDMWCESKLAVSVDSGIVPLAPSVLY